MEGTSYVQVAERSIAYDSLPDTTVDGGLVVVFVHGSSTDRRCWQGVVPHLGRTHRAVAFDNPGHGQSGLPALKDIDDGVDVTHGLITALGLGRVVLIGHSMGGAIVQRYLQRYPDEVQAVGLASTAPNFALPADLVQRWLNDAAAYLSEEAAMITAPTCPADVRKQLANMRDSITAEGQRSDLLTCAAWDNTDRWDEVPVPALLVTATADTPLFQEAAAGWRQALGQRATWAEIPNAGHMMLVEQPKLTGIVIADWLKTVARRS